MIEIHDCGEHDASLPCDSQSLEVHNSKQHLSNQRGMDQRASIEARARWEATVHCTRLTHTNFSPNSSH
jgi:hypothetical protein